MQLNAVNFADGPHGCLFDGVSAVGPLIGLDGLPGVGRSRAVLLQSGAA